MAYYEKYIKYKTKYTNLKMIGGSETKENVEYRLYFMSDILLKYLRDGIEPSQEINKEYLQTIKNENDNIFFNKGKYGMDLPSYFITKREGLDIDGMLYVVPKTMIIYNMYDPTTNYKTTQYTKEEYKTLLNLKSTNKLLLLKKIPEINDAISSIKEFFKKKSSNEIENDTSYTELERYIKILIDCEINNTTIIDNLMLGALYCNFTLSANLLDRENKIKENINYELINTKLSVNYYCVDYVFLVKCENNSKKIIWYTRFIAKPQPEY